MDLEAFEEWIYHRLPNSKNTRSHRLRYLHFIHKKLGIDLDSFDKEYKISKALHETKRSLHSLNNCVTAINLYLEFRGIDFRLKKIPLKGTIDRYVPEDRVVEQVQTVVWERGYHTRRYRLLLKILALGGLRISEAIQLKKENFSYKEVRTQIDLRSVLIQKILSQWEEDGTPLTVQDFRTLVKGDIPTLTALVGLSPNEVEQAPIKNYFVHVTGKGNKERNVPIPKDLYKHVMDYMALDGARSGYLFDNGRGTFLSTHTARKAVKFAGEKIGEGRLHPHAFRHWRARDLWRKRVDLIVISRFLGHTDIQTTKIYLEAISEEEQFEEIVSRDPFFGLGEVVLKDILFSDQIIGGGLKE